MVNWGKDLAGQRGREKYACAKLGKIQMENMSMQNWAQVCKSMYMQIGRRDAQNMHNVHEEFVYAKSENASRSMKNVDVWRMQRLAKYIPVGEKLHNIFTL